MSDLTAFRDHARAMAQAQHKPDCPSLTAREPYWPPGGWVPMDGNDPMNGLRWIGPKPPWSPPDCDGCVTNADREMWARLADEIDHYLHPEQDAGDDDALWT